MLFLTGDDVIDAFPFREVVNHAKNIELKVTSYNEPVWLLTQKNGKEYVIYLKIKDEKNPRAGSGVGAVCDVIETHEIADKAGALIKEFTTEYYNCEITATIDKETGRMVHAVYKTPLKMLMVVNMFGTHNVGASITFTKDYTITY